MITSIIIPTVNAPILKECLNAISAKTHSEYELIIVCDTPNEERKHLLEKSGAKVIINENRVGIPRALNQGLGVSKGEYIIIMNDDIIIQSEDWLDSLVKVLEAHPEFGIVCPRVIHPDCDEKDFFAAIGECSLMTRELFDKIGKFDESEEFSYLCSDGDYYMRCKQAGYTIVGINEVSVYHQVGQTVKPELTKEKLEAPMITLYERYGNAIKVDQHRHLVYSPAEDKLILKGEMIELGGGNNPQFHPNLDIRAGFGVDIVANLEEGLPIEDESYGGVWCSYALEHISWRTVKNFLKEAYRILRPEGKAVFITANLKEQARVIANKEWGDPSDEFYESRLVFGDLDYPENSHKVGFSPEFATKLFNEIGFQTKVEPHPNCPTDMIIKATKTSPVIDRFTWIRNQIEKLTKDKPSAQVLDVGCQDCLATYQMVNCTWVDIESYEKVSNLMKQTGRTPIPRDRFMQVDGAHDLPFNNKQFEVALNTELLEHVENPVDVLKETKRIAKWVIITVPDEYSWDEKWKPFTNPHHVRHYTEQMLKQHLKEAGIKGYKMGRLGYEGWSFFTAVAGLGEVSTVKKKVKEKIIPPIIAHQYMSDPNKLKVALLSTPFLTVPPRNYGGLEKIVYDIGYCLAKDGHKVTVFAPNGSNVEGCEMVYFGEALEKVQVNWLEAERNAINIVADRIMNDGYDIIHGHDWFGFEYALKAKNNNLKVTHTHHGGLNMDWWGKVKPPFPLNLIAISNWMQQIYASLGFQSRVVYNGIPIEDYPFKAEKGDRLLFVGRLDSFKRPHIAIEVAKKTGLGLDIVGGSFVGDIPYMESIKQACDGEQIRLYLDASQEEKVKLYQNAKAVIFPSKMGEPFGLIVPESLATGTPVIASRDGAIPETMVDGVTGYVCDIDDTDQMVEAVKKVDKIKPEDCRSRAEMFSREESARNYVKSYEEVLEGREW